MAPDEFELWAGFFQITQEEQAEMAKAIGPMAMMLGRR